MPNMEAVNALWGVAYLAKKSPVVFVKSSRHVWACPSGFTFVYIFLMIPFSSIRKVVLSVPMNFLP